jgi:nucleoid DNA-binding protein
MNASQLTKIIAKETGEPAYKVNKILSATIKVIRQQIKKFAYYFY